MFSPSLIVFDKHLCNGERFFPKTWDLSPTGKGKILKSNSLLSLQPHFQRVLM